MPKRRGSTSSSSEPDPDGCAIFPVKLTAKHLPKLNEVFQDLARILEHALKVYKEGDNYGRDGVTGGLVAINVFFLLFEVIDKDNLNTPLSTIISALTALNQNNQLPILTPNPSSGRSKSSSMRSVLEAWAVVTVEQIMATGAPVDKACETVAKHLVKAGVKSSRGNAPISGRTVRNWKQRASEDSYEKKTILTQARKMLRDLIKASDIEGDITVEESLEHLSTLLELAHPANLR
jgi:hypothetical protein